MYSMKKQAFFFWKRVLLSLQASLQTYNTIKYFFQSLPQICGVYPSGV